jgi:hypothetical protein
VRPALVALALCAGLAPRAGAWPAETATAISRDARRLVPRSLSRLLGERETAIRDEMDRFPPELGRALALDLPTGRLRPSTTAALDGEVAAVVALFREKRVSEGLVRLGALARIATDLSDPVLAVGPEGWPSGLAREYYGLFADNLGRMPVVVDTSQSLEIPRAALPALWQTLVERSRDGVPTIRAEFVHEGRVRSHRQLDYRSPAWAVASLAYSRAVSATAATWLAAWGEARGDATHTPRPRVVVPRESPSGSAAFRPAPAPEAP